MTIEIQKSFEIASGWVIAGVGGGFAVAIIQTEFHPIIKILSPILLILVFTAVRWLAFDRYKDDETVDEKLAELQEGVAELQDDVDDLKEEVTTHEREHRTE